MNVILVFLSIVFITVIGYSFINFFKILNGFDKLLRLSYSFGLGIIFVSFQLYCYSRLNIVWTSADILTPWVIFILIHIIKNRNLLTKLPKWPRLKKVDYLLLFFIAFCTFYAVFEALIRPPVAWDSWAAWLFQSKMFFLGNNIDPSLLRHYNFYYPILYYLLNSFVFIIIGNFDDTSILLISSAFYFFTLLLFFGFTSRRYGIRKGLFFTFLLAALQNLIRHGGRMEAGLADLPLGYLAFCSTTLLLDYIDNKGVKTLTLMSIFLAGTALTKSEGLPFALVIGAIVIYYIFKNKLFSHFIYLLIWVVPIVDWEAYKRSNGIMSYFSGHYFVTSWIKFSDSLLGTLKELINIKSWNLIWFSYFVSLMLKKSWTKYGLILNVIVLSQLIFYIVTYIFTAGNSPESSIERLLIHIVPIAMLEIMFVINYEKFNLGKLFGFKNRKIMKFIADYVS